MSDEIPHPSTQYFMGWAESPAESSARMRREEAAMERDDEDWEEDEPPRHIWPLMSYMEDDARWKLGRTVEIELYALCGVRLYDYVMRLDGGAPVPFGDHWVDNDVCEECLERWHARRSSL